MPNPDYQTNFGPLIAEYWQAHYPGKAAALQEAGTLIARADYAATVAAEDLVENLKLGIRFEAAYELAAIRLQAEPGEAFARKAGHEAA